MQRKGGMFHHMTEALKLRFQPVMNRSKREEDGFGLEAGFLGWICNERICDMNSLGLKQSLLTVV